jgi:hypothetical protein
MSKTARGPSSVELLTRDEEPASFYTCEYLAGISKDLSRLAYENGLDTLAIIFDMARQDAERILQASDEHLNRS